MQPGSFSRGRSGRGLMGQWEDWRNDHPQFTSRFFCMATVVVVITVASLIGTSLEKLERSVPSLPCPNVPYLSVPNSQVPTALPPLRHCLASPPLNRVRERGAWATSAWRRTRQ